MPASWISNFPSALALGRALRATVNEINAPVTGREALNAREVEDVILAVAAAVAGELSEYEYDEFVESLSDGYHERDIA